MSNNRVTQLKVAKNEKEQTVEPEMEAPYDGCPAIDENRPGQNPPASDNGAADIFADFQLKSG